jgi:hypothetical protein
MQTASFLIVIILLVVSLLYNTAGPQPVDTQQKMRLKAEEICRGKTEETAHHMCTEIIIEIFHLLNTTNLSAAGSFLV